MLKNRFASKHLDFTDLITEAAVAVYMLVIINGYVALSQLNTQFYYIVTVDVTASIGWGLIDGFTYTLGESVDRERQNTLVKKIRADRSLDEIVKALGDTFVSQYSDAGKRSIAAEIARQSPDSKIRKQTFVTREDLAGLASIMGIYLTAGLALSVSYIILSNKLEAWLVSNTIGIVWLFFYGYRIGKMEGQKRFLVGLLTAGAGLAFLVLSYIRFA